MNPRPPERDGRRLAPAACASLLPLLSEGIGVYGPEGRLRFVNDAYRRILAGAPGSLGDSLADIVAARAGCGEFLDGDAAARARLALAADPAAPPLRRRRPNGATIETRAARLPDGGHVALVADLSAIAEADRQRARAESLLDGVLTHCPAGISIYGPDRRLCLVNDTYGHIMSGAPVALGDAVDDIIDRRARSGEYGAGDPAELARIQRQHDNTRLQRRRRRRPDGRLIDIRTAPLPGGHHISVVTDVTALADAETGLARQTGTLEALLPQIRHGIVLWDNDGRIVVANAAAATLQGLPPDAIAPGCRLPDVIAAMLQYGSLGEGPPARQRAQWLAAQDRRDPHHERRITRHGRVLDIHSSPTATGGFVTVCEDATAACETAEALRLCRIAAGAAETAKARFLSGIGDALRTPILAIIDAADALDPAAAAPPLTGAASPGRIGAAARELLGTVDLLLDLRDSEADRFDLSEDEVDVPTLLHAVARRFNARAAAAEAALLIDTPENFPKLRADRRRLGDALSHAVARAIGAIGPVGSISLGARHDWARGTVLLEVTDNGPGLGDAELERAFDGGAQPCPAPWPPQPGQPGQRPASLGLYVARILLRAHGGDLTLRSLPGQGTTATLLIPAARVLPPGAEPAKEP